jgi:hypothetical protein
MMIQNNELERMWNEAIMGQFEVLSSHFVWIDSEKRLNNPDRIAGVSV